MLLRAFTSAGSADTSVFTRSNSPALIAANRSGSVDSMMVDSIATFRPRFSPGHDDGLFGRRRPDGGPPGTAAARIGAERRAPARSADGQQSVHCLETIQPERSAIASRRAAQRATAPRFGGFLNSWTQTGFRIGDITVTDPRTGGTPLLLPILPFWDQITVSTGAMGVDDNAPAVSMALEPPRPGTRWVRAVEGLFSGPALVSAGTGPVPAVDRVRQWQDGNVLASGPITDRLGLVAAGSWRGLSHVAAPNASATNDRVASGLAHSCLQRHGGTRSARLAGHSGSRRPPSRIRGSTFSPPGSGTILLS